ncbi:MAG TPA: hypothetical protein VNO30_11955 [Kofleriaceae bacterium]|nr:hypothetical protein [Kofleriaceae bacterium]
MATHSRDRWNGARYRAGEQGGHYESWFLRANDAAGQRAFWIRYTIFAPRGRPADAVGELWAIASERAPGRIVAVKEVHPIGACAFAPDRLDVRIGAARLDGGALRGGAASGGHAIAWDLRYGGGGGGDEGEAPLLLLPAALYGAPLPRAKALVPAPLARFSGTLTVDGAPLAIDDWLGSQNHNWGSRHTDRYAWGQVAGFDGRPDAFLECSTARLRVGPVWTPWMSPVVLRLRGETLGWNALPRAIRARGHYELRDGVYDWRIETSGAAGALSVRFWAAPEELVALRYDNPPGGAKICLNSKLARCELTLRRGGQTIELCSARAAFEILEDSAPPGVTTVA